MIAYAPPMRALVFASLDTEPQDERPPDFPFWEHVTQRRYAGPTVLYLGGGYAMTARHVGMGEIQLRDVMHKPVRDSKRSLLNENGSAADVMIFELDRNAVLPDLPILPIASEPLQPGEDVLLVGFGRGRGTVIEYDIDGQTRFGFSWSKKGEKRWGTNRVSSNSEILSQSNFMTRALSLRFDGPFAPDTTRYETHAAIGDSGGGVFVQRDGIWKLAAMMISIGGEARSPRSSTVYGDMTFAADLTYYRDEILRWTRPICSNERDDDGDDLIDFPADPGCDSASDRNEWEANPFEAKSLWLATTGALGAGWLIIYLGRRGLRSQRGTSTPNSTRPSSAD
ncbi:MAG: trypsin-like peptidase domain-containing protein [bacterium]|nr:trypsin-like peptidase domain-containing protein [bacterium]